MQQPARTEASPGKDENYKDKDEGAAATVEAQPATGDDDWDDEPPVHTTSTVTATLFVPVNPEAVAVSGTDRAGTSSGGAGQHASGQSGSSTDGTLVHPAIQAGAVASATAAAAAALSRHDATQASVKAGKAGTDRAGSAGTFMPVTGSGTGAGQAVPGVGAGPATASMAGGSSSAASPAASGVSGAGTQPAPEGKPGDAAVARTRRQSEGAPAPVVPDFCNAGVAMRTAVIAHLGLVAVLCTQSQSWASGGIGGWSYLFMAFEGSLLINMVCLCLMRKFLNGQQQKIQWVLGAAIPAVLTMLYSAFVLLPAKDAWLLRHDAVADGAVYTIWSVLAHGVAASLFAVAFFIYFRLRARAMAPSFSEARLQALQARIRPHFLFNSLNTVLGLIRTDPKRAESTLENLADLFRVFMRDARELVPLDDEVITCKEYLAIEKLRLAPRLAVTWNIDEMPGDALLPSLLLQPLLENAVHHGIEPRTDEGMLNISIRLVGERVRVEVDNPVSATVASRPGNQMALSNVRERLMLLYDTEAELRTGPQGDRYHVLLEFPYRKERRRRDVRRHFNPDR
ncbi:MAG: histidine kinase [Lautropia sp.]|nr:histidine kinase [Lautropia sp.]